MNRLFTLFIVAFVSLMAVAQKQSVLFDNSDAPMLSWSVAYTATAADVQGLKAGDVFEVTVAEVKADSDWPKFGFEAGGKDNYPDEFQMWDHRSETPYVAKYTVTEADLELLSNGFDIKGDGVRIVKVVYVQTVKEELPEGQTLIYNNPDSQMLSWSVLCSVTAAQVQGLKAGDVFEVTVAEVKTDSDWPKFGFEAGGKDNYPEAFQMWDHRSETPYVAKYTVTEADLELLSNGFDIKGDGVRITKVVLVKTVKEELPEGQTLIYNDPDSKMLSWGVLCSVTAAQVQGIKAGDKFEVTVAEVKADNEWPKFGFEADGKDNYPEEFTMWDHRSETPYVATYYVTEDDVELLKNGFDIKGDGVRITRVVFISSSSDDNNERVLWQGAPVLMTWGDVNAEVSSGKASIIKSGDTMAVTITSVVADAKWPKVLCRASATWEEILTIELSADDAAAAPIVKTVTVTDAMLNLMAGGFFFGGEGVYIEKVALVNDNTSGIDDVIVDSEATRVNVFSINGVCVRSNVDASAATVGLPRGLYIVNGKKILVK